MTLQPFDKQLSRVYTRAVFKKYRETFIYSTAFRIDPEEGQANSYLVTRTNQTKAYSWFQHSFKVEADVKAREYTCECKTWEHTGKLRIMHSHMLIHCQEGTHRLDHNYQFTIFYTTS